MTSKIPTNPITPSSVGQDLICHEEESDYGQIFKGIIHALLIPFALAFWNPAVAFGYLACAGLLYGTIFRHKSQGFWGTIIMVVFLVTLFMMPN